MSVYRCEQCDTYQDADIDGVEEHPFKDLVCVCDACYDFLSEFPEAKEKIKQEK